MCRILLPQREKFAKLNSGIAGIGSMSLIDLSVASAMTKEVKTIEEDKPLLEGVKLMRNAHIGSIVVVGESGPAGIFTEKDLVRRVAETVENLNLTMGQVMSKPLTTVLPTDSVWDALALMGSKKIRHLPVVQADRLVGILTESDVVRLILHRTNSSWGDF